MKSIRLLSALFALALAGLAISGPVALTGCTTKTQVVAVQSLKIVGQVAEDGVVLSAKLYEDKKITARQAREVMDFYDLKFMPVFKDAVAVVLGDVNAPAPKGVLEIAARFASLVSNLQPPR